MLTSQSLFSLSQPRALSGVAVLPGRARVGEAIPFYAVTHPVARIKKTLNEKEREKGPTLEGDKPLSTNSYGNKIDETHV